MLGDTGCITDGLRQ